MRRLFTTGDARSRGLTMATSRLISLKWLKPRSWGTDSWFVRFAFKRRPPQKGNDGQYVDVLLSLWPYLDEDSQDTLIRERPPSAPVLLAAFRRAALAKQSEQGDVNQDTDGQAETA
jgi:hypothetical protein